MKSITKTITVLVEYGTLDKPDSPFSPTVRLHTAGMPIGNPHPTNVLKVAQFQVEVPLKYEAIENVTVSDSVLELESIPTPQPEIVQPKARKAKPSSGLTAE